VIEFRLIVRAVKRGPYALHEPAAPDPAASPAIPAIA
jgi:hypothetical protein